MKLQELFLETTASTGRPEIFVDMDGVLADLFGHVGSLHNVEHYNQMTGDQWEDFLKNTNAYELFRNLPAFKTANQLLEFTQRYGGYSILSSPLNYDKKMSIAGKKEWLSKNITVPAKKQIFEHDKYLYAKQPNGTPNILIDDYGVNITKWREAGGIAIKYQADKHSLSKVENELREAFLSLEKNKKQISKDTTTNKDHESNRIHSREKTQDPDSEPMLSR